MTFILRPYQKTCVDQTLIDLQSHQRVLNVLPTGCLAGDTNINTNRAGMGRTYTIKRIYNSIHGNPDKIPNLKQFNKNIPTYIRAFNGKSVQLHKIVDCVYSGKKEVFRIHLSNGKSIKATKCHKMMTKEGWKKVEDLIVNTDHLMCDNLNIKKSNKKRKPKRYDPMISNLWYHPYAPITKTKKETRGWTKRIEIHRAIYEANLNNITIDEYIKILRNDEKKSKTLKLIDSKLFHIHHKDHNHKNNDVNNLEALSVTEHLTKHGNHKNFNQGIISYSKIISIIPIDIEDTYDIICEDPYRNFVADGIVVHNSGKTECFIDIADKFIKMNPSKAVLILSHLTLLTEQTADRFELRASHLRTNIMQQDQKPKWDTTVVISTMQTSRKQTRIDWIKENLVRHIGLIIVDEAHYLPTDSYQIIMNSYPNAKVVGVTATPYRSRRIMTPYFDKVSYTISMYELIKMGYLVPPKVHEIVLPSKNIEDVMGMMLHLYKTYQNGKQGIIFMQSVEDSRMLATAFKEMGIKATSVTEELRGDYRTGILQDFSKGKIKILTTVNVLTAGFDSPNVDFILMPYGTKSPTAYIQRTGRGLRPRKGKTHCDIYVGGKAPSVANRVAERLMDKLLKAGSSTPIQDTFLEEAKYNPHDTGSDIYIWNKNVVKAIKRMKKLGMTNFANLLNTRQFPKRFMQDINELLKNLPSSPSLLKDGHIAASQNQKTVLFKAGFGSQALSTISKNEAHMMISSLANKKNSSLSRQHFIMSEGTHKGKPVWDTPQAYRKLVKKRYPDSPVAKTIIKWEKHRKEVESSKKKNTNITQKEKF